MTKAAFLILFFILSQNIFSQHSIIIPFGSIIKADGILTSEEWDDAKIITIKLGQEGSLDVLIKHDNKNINYCYQFNVENKSILCFPEIYIDPLHNTGDQWQPDDWWFHVSGTDCVSQGSPDNYDNCRKEHKDWTANPNFALGENSIPLFEFEISIPIKKLGVNINDKFGMALAGALFWTEKDKNNELKKLFPDNCITENPSTWGEWILQEEQF